RLHLQLPGEAGDLAPRPARIGADHGFGAAATVGERADRNHGPRGRSEAHEENHLRLFQWYHHASPSHDSRVACSTVYGTHAATTVPTMSESSSMAPRWPRNSLRKS